MGTRERIMGALPRGLGVVLRGEGSLLETFIIVFRALNVSWHFRKKADAGIWGDGSVNTVLT